MTWNMTKWHEETTKTRLKEYMGQLEEILRLPEFTGDDYWAIHRFLKDLKRNCLYEKKQCPICLNEVLKDEIVAHHIVPRECEGDDNKSNMLYICRSCHQDIHRVYRATAMMVANNSPDFFTNCIEHTMKMHKERRGK